MRKAYPYGTRQIRLLLKGAPLLLLVILPLKTMGQEPPPRPVNVTVQQDLGFGAFYHGVTGGEVTVNPDGSRLATGDIVLLTMGYPYSPAQYRITGTPGTVISLLYGPDVLLPGSNGGSLNFQIGNSDPPSPFVLTAGPLLLYLGGTITVGNPGSNPPGNYSGTFDITFVQE